LFNFLNDSQRKELVWGDFDCVVGLANGAVEAQTGVDLAKPFKGKYKTQNAALKFLARQGYDRNSLAEALVKLMDEFLQRAPKGNRHRGNIVLLETELGPAFSVRVGNEAVALASGGGTRTFKVPKGSLEWVVT